MTGILPAQNANLITVGASKSPSGITARLSRAQTKAQRIDNILAVLRKRPAFSDAEIARRTGLPERSVRRYMAELRQERHGQIHSEPTAYRTGKRHATRLTPFGIAASRPVHNSGRQTKKQHTRQHKAWNGPQHTVVADITSTTTSKNKRNAELPKKQAAQLPVNSTQHRSPAYSLTVERMHARIKDKTGLQKNRKTDNIIQFEYLTHRS